MSTQLSQRSPSKLGSLGAFSVSNQHLKPLKNSASTEKTPKFVSLKLRKSCTAKRSRTEWTLNTRPSKNTEPNPQTSHLNPRDNAQKCCLCFRHRTISELQGRNLQQIMMSKKWKKRQAGRARSQKRTRSPEKIMGWRWIASERSNFAFKWDMKSLTPRDNATAGYWKHAATKQ